VSRDARPFDFPPRLRAPGTLDAPFLPSLALAELELGTMRRVSHDDLDLLLVHLPEGILAIADRCPHMSAPLSVGDLDGGVVACPLHEGRFDLRTGLPERMPTTGGLDPDGVYRPPWTPAGRTPRDDVPGRKAEARRLTRVRRIRYYPVRVVGDMIEVAIPD
jgi:nitrite reductase/ring-hydroxylating ferredoxin subunit